MVHQALITQWSFTGPFEGVVPHLYLDSGGLITAGVGFMFPKLTDARLLSWEPPRDLELDWAEMQQLRSVITDFTKFSAGYYRSRTRARLTDATMRAEFTLRMARLERPLTGLFTGYLSYPEPVRIALRDMAYNLGVGGLGKFVQLRAACEKRDWATAAAQCRRKGVQAARNQATMDAFLSAA